MTEGWRTIIVESAEALHLQNNDLVIAGGDDFVLPLSQIQRILIASPKGTISVPLLQRLCSSNVELVICDEKYNPSGELIPFGSHSRTAGCMQIQSAWTEQEKNEMWREIVVAKIQNQIETLRECHIEIPEELAACVSAVLPGDETNREGVAARLYFNALFGMDFIRHTENELNAALNYGYTILLSAMTRVIASYGYHTALGIHHHSRYNRFNLASDLMEPFRPAIDKMVYRNKNRPLSWDYKKELISLLVADCYYANRRMSVQTAMELYALDVFGAMTDPKRQIYRLTFVEK